MLMHGITYEAVLLFIIPLAYNVYDFVQLLSDRSPVSKLNIIVRKMAIVL